MKKFIVLALAAFLSYIPIAAFAEDAPAACKTAEASDKEFTDIGAVKLKVFEDPVEAQAILEELRSLNGFPQEVANADAITLWRNPSNMMYVGISIYYKGCMVEDGVLPLPAMMQLISNAHEKMNKTNQMSF